ncbi:MAG TPA: hypothetical protein VFZ53_03160 [Polyangiaceae bacterium]
MRTSKLYLGMSGQFESDVRRRVGANLDELHRLAQRICQAALAPARASRDLPPVIQILERRAGECFMGQLSRAFGFRLLGREDDADRAFRRATELVPDGDPWSHLVPDTAEWRAPTRPAALVEEEPGHVYRIAGETRAEGAVFGTLGVGRFLRMQSGELVYVNPVPLADEVVAEVRRLGSVAHVIAPAKYHFAHVTGAARAFPGARVWGVPAHRGFARVARIPFDGYLDDAAPLYPGELEQLTIDGNDIGDVWLLYRRTRTLMTTDALFFAGPVAADAADFDSPFRRFYAWAWGVADRTGVPSYQPPMWRDLRAFGASLARAFDLEFDTVAYNHGSWRAIPREGREQLRAALGFVTKLKTLDALRLTFDFVRRHPGFTYRELASRPTQPHNR